jgi:hypothetical protein
MKSAYYWIVNRLVKVLYWNKSAYVVCYIKRK